MARSAPSAAPEKPRKKRLSAAERLTVWGVAMFVRDASGKLVSNPALRGSLRSREREGRASCFGSFR